MAYKSVKPGGFFPKSNIGDNSMANWRIDYDIIDRKIHPPGIFTRNARFVSAKWRRDDIPDREVIVIPIQRTVPANEQTKFKQFIGLAQRTDIIVTPIKAGVLSHVARILGKDASGYERISLKEDPAKSILVGTKKQNDYSQFHFGAGEASIIEMVTKIEDAKDNALILIEEIENGLHPLATRKMIEYLFDVAKRKKSQIIFTTHSEYALDILPPKAIWGCIDGVAYQGKLTIESLRALTGTVSKDRAIFVEDDFAKDLCTEILRQYAMDLLDHVEIHKAGGFPYVVEVLKYHNANPTIKKKAVAVIDGDNPPLNEPNDHVLELPDGTPEAVVFGYIIEKCNDVAALVQQRCQCPTISQDKVVEAIKSVSIDTTDHHLYFAKLGERLGFVSEIIVRRGLCSIYVQNKKLELENLVEGLKIRLQS
ncbi:AAA family ATPase [Methylobacterium sp. WL6]|uniref:AAA family ATPase n=1 Tax=Methylobacterium sp. WL6 TaxID=2603901 RepID=UPI0011C700A6|nr:AAA family ATPase [Methylobacterium sp. WL6]TXN65024.1 ATP-binding protein [Methylobacterium sp. WL6]